MSSLGEGADESLAQSGFGFGHVGLIAVNASDRRERVITIQCRLFNKNMDTPLIKFTIWYRYYLVYY